MVIKTSVEMRKNPLFMRNTFKTYGKWEVPVIIKQAIPLDHVELVAYSDTRRNDRPENRSRGVHFFVDDYRFNDLYYHPDRSLEKLRQYAFLFSPDYSVYADMPMGRQLESVWHSRWVGAYWQSKGLTVIPTVMWSDARSFSFCFDGIEKGSIVAVGMIGCKKNNKKANLLGYNAMLERIEPSAVICFGKPFPEMKGELIVVDYMASRKVVR